MIHWAGAILALLDGFRKPLESGEDCGAEGSIDSRTAEQLGITAANLAGFRPEEANSTPIRSWSRVIFSEKMLFEAK